MTEKKQNTVGKTTEVKKENHQNVVVPPGFIQNTQTQTSTTEILDNLTKGTETCKGQRNMNVHIHNATCTITNAYETKITPETNGLLDFLIKIAPLMVKDSSITAVDFIAAVLKEVPLMVKDSSITHPELLDVMINVKSTLLPKAA